MSKDAFDLVEQAMRSGGSKKGFDFLARRFREEKNYPLLFEARLMKKRHEVGLPLIRIDTPDDLPEDKQRAFEEGCIEAAREVGSLFLADGDIQRAWPYFRAIGEVSPVTAAIEQVEPGKGIEPIIEIAFHGGVHPRKGLELILAHFGICRAISSFQQYPSRVGREECVRLLVGTLCDDLVESLKRTIARKEGQRPDTGSISGLIADRDWLFEGDNYYVDTSHLVSVIRFSVESTEPETLARAVELTEYGKRLSPQFQSRGDPPFQNVYVDYGLYLRVLLGQEVDSTIAHFRQKITRADPNEMDTSPAQVLVGLLARLERYSEAIEVSIKHLPHPDPSELTCPSVPQLCQLAEDYKGLMKLAREKRDLLSFTAAVLQTPPA